MNSADLSIHIVNQLKCDYIYKLLMEKISTNNAPAAIGPYSQGMIVGN